MHPSVRTMVEPARGCGYRSAGGIYLLSGGYSAPCGRLPIPLETCPTCSCGIKPSRGWTWVNGAALAAPYPCSGGQCYRCPLGSPPERVGLLWVGEKFYSSPEAFNAEANARGISRRIAAIPHGFNLIRTWVWLAHRSACRRPDGVPTAGVFRAFKPERVEYVLKGDETNEQIEALLDRGLSPIRVIRDVDHTPLFSEPSEN
jgi:hypothetical protein